MNRRQILKATLLAPLLGLFKSRKSGASTRLTKRKMSDDPFFQGRLGIPFTETTGTSGGNYTCWHFLDEEPEIYNGILDPNEAYAKSQGKRYKEIWDEIVIKLYGNEKERTLF